MNREFLFELISTQSVSGGELEIQKKVAAYMRGAGVAVTTDYAGNVRACCNEDSPLRVLLCGHADEIGYRVTHVTDEGYLHVGKAGGVRLSLAQGQRVTVLGRRPVPGVMGLLLSKGEVKTDPEATELYIDCGFRGREEALALVAPGDFATYSCAADALENGRIAGRGLDDKLGVYVVLHALLRAREKGATVGVYAAATTGEETTMRGAYYASSGLAPTLCVAVDVIHATDFSGSLPQRFGKIDLGGGPVLCRGSITNAPVNAALEAAAARLNMPLQYQILPGVTGTDADKVNQTGRGTPVTVLSVPVRYMHSPSEVADLGDVEQTVELLAEFLCGLDQGFKPDPFAED